MKFVCFTTTAGNPVYVNLDNVSVVKDAGNGSTSLDSITVTAPIAQVVAVLCLEQKALTDLEQAKVKK
jgi:hypothetical protein